MRSEDKYDRAYRTGYADGYAGRVARPPVDDAEINYRDGYADGMDKREAEAGR